MKKIVVCLLAAALCLGISGCGDGKPEKPEGEENSYQEDNVVPIAITDDANIEKVKTAGFALGEAAEDAGAFTLPLLVGDGMLLQANVVTRIWGRTSETGDVAVRVSRNGESRVYYDTVYDGEFSVYIGKTDYGRDYRVEIVTESGKKRTVNNVAFGELYIGAGQSNMGWSMGQCYGKTVAERRYEKDILASKNPAIRLFTVYPQQSDTPLTDIVRSSTDGWREAEPGVVSGFSAVAYYFAREINARYDVPVGVIASCMGGTSVYTWMPEFVRGQARGEKPGDLGSQYYNGMIAPLSNVVPRGVLWYQGEGQSKDYAHNYSLVISGWRAMFGKDNVYFCTVQLPRHVDEQEYYDSREEQKKASLENEYCTYSVNIDRGLVPSQRAEGDTLNADGIHPYDKKPVGIRLAHATMQAFYGAEGVWRGPVFKSAEVREGKVIVTFSGVGKGLKLYGGAGFEIGEEGKAMRTGKVNVIAPDKIEVYADDVAAPSKLRYGFVNSDPSILLFTSYEQSVCLYNTKGDGEKAYPAEQFFWQFT